MKKYTLKNNLTVIEYQKQSDSVTLQVTVKTGSNSEVKGIRGISHFIEHMVFEGTTTRQNAKEISNEIESLGGEINAYTDNVRTCFYIKVPKKHFEKAAKIVSDIMKHPLFRKEDIDKERAVILKEINIFNDESRFFQWLLFQKTLFGERPQGYPAYGTVEDVKKINRDNIVNYFNTYYLARNAVITLVGDFNESEAILNKYFSDMKDGKVSVKQAKAVKLINTHKVKKVKRRITNSYMVFGYETVPRSHEDSYILDIIQALLGKGQSGRLFNEIRNKRGLAYEVGVHNECSKETGFFTVYLSTDKKNIKLITNLILEEFQKLKSIDDNELNDAKGFVEGRYLLDNEDTHNKADVLGFWELIEDGELEKEYINNIQKVSKEDIKRIVDKYLTKDYTLTVVEQEDKKKK